MKSNRLWIVGTAIVVLVVIGAGWLLGIQPLLTATATANDSADAVDAINADEQAALLQLKKEYEDIDAIRADVDTAELSVPTSAGLSAFILQVTNLAAATGVQVSEITTGDGLLYVLPEGATILNDKGEPVAAPVAPDNLAFVPLNIKVSGPYASVLTFVNGLQTGQRLYMVNEVAVARLDAAAADPNSKVPTAVSFEGEIRGQLYVLVDFAPAEDVPVTEGEPVPAPSPSASPAA